MPPSLILKRWPRVCDPPYAQRRCGRITEQERRCSPVRDIADAPVSAEPFSPDNNARSLRGQLHSPQSREHTIALLSRIPRDTPGISSEDVQKQPVEMPCADCSLMRRTTCILLSQRRKIAGSYCPTLLYGLSPQSRLTGDRYIVEFKHALAGVLTKLR